jgi:DNA-binding transcriptional LysR family regulator
MIRMVNLASFDLNLLVVLDALISEAHVGRAARKIGLSQPAASHALNRLRELLADPLLVRVGSRMELTPRAMALRDSLGDALQRVQSVFVEDSFQPGKSSRRFSLMMQDHVAHLIVPPLIKRVHCDAPGVSLDFLPWQSPLSMKTERFRSIDLLISCAVDELPGFQRETLFTDTEATVIRKRHPFAGRMKDLKAFLNARHVAVIGGGLTEDPVDTWLRHEGLTRKIVLRVPSYVQALQAVGQTDLVAFVPRRLAESLARRLSLSVIRPALDPGDYHEQLFYSHRSVQDSASVWLRKLVLKIGADLWPVDECQAQKTSREPTC